HGGAYGSFFRPLCESGSRCAQLFFWGVFFLVDVDGENVGTWLFFLDAISAPRRGRCARRDTGNRNFCPHPRRTNKSDRNTLPMRSLVEMRCEQVFGSPPFAREYGKLTVITNR